MKSSGHTVSVLLLFLLVLTLLFQPIPAQAGSNAQSEPIFMTIEEVDSSAFPTVVAYVSVEDAAGDPVRGLAAENFSIFEDDLQAAADSITVEEDLDQQLNLVIAIDTSTSDQTLAAYQEAAKTLIEQLGPNDNAAVISFAEEVVTLKDFTGDYEELSAAIDSIKLKGYLTSLNETIMIAVELLATRTQGRKVALILADFDNNIGDIPTVDVITRALEVNVPVHITGVEPKVQPGEFIELSQLTGGESIVAASFKTIGAEVDRLAVDHILRQSYKITFRSGLAADNQMHTLKIQAVEGERQAEAISSFRAFNNPVHITLDGFSDGDDISGKVLLAPKIEAYGDLTEVSYFVGNELISQQTEPPFEIEWDSFATGIGTRALTIQGIDSANNVGQLRVVLEVAPPLTIEIITSDTDIVIGEKVTVTAQVVSISTVETVEYLIAGEVIGSASTAPYQVKIDTARYPAGSYTITASAANQQGYSEQAQHNFRLLERPLNEEELLSTIRKNRISLAVLVLIGLVLLGIAILAAVLLIAWQRRRFTRRYQLELTNLGNVPGCFKLEAEDPAGTLKFKYLLNGADLLAHAREQAVTSSAEPQPKKEDKKASKKDKKTKAKKKPKPQPRQSSSSGGGGMNVINQKTRKPNIIMQGLAGIAGVLGSILPASMGGTAMKNFATRIRSAQTRVKSTTRKPTQSMGQANMMGQQVNRMKDPSGRASKTTGKRAAGVSDSDFESEEEDETIIMEDTRQIGRKKMLSETQQAQDGQADGGNLMAHWAQTPFIKTGDSLLIDLIIKPRRRPRKDKIIDFVLRSFLLQADEPKIQVENYSTTIEGLSFWRDYILPFGTMLLILLLATAVLLFLFILLGVNLSI
jgi:hypothetical protein